MSSPKAESMTALTGAVLSLGEALIDLSESESAEPQPRVIYTPHPGGSSVNVAVGLSRLGHAVQFCGSFADDVLGRRIRDFLTAEGVLLDHSIIVSANTALALMTLHNAEPQYSFYASPASYGLLPPDQISREAVLSAPVVHAGSLGILERSTYQAIVEVFQTSQGLKTLDPNVRPSLVTDWDEYRDRIDRLIQLSSVVKFSLEDIEALYGNEPVELIVARVLGAGVSAVMITRAADGVEIWTATGRIVQPIPTGFAVVDTTGAGDSTMAATISWLVTNGIPKSLNEWSNLAAAAMKAAAITCTRPGGAVAMPTIREVG